MIETSTSMIETSTSMIDTGTSVIETHRCDYTIMNFVHYGAPYWWTISLDSKHTEARFSPNSTDSLCFLVAQVPRPPDMAIFLLTTTTTTTTTTRPITLPLAHARGVTKALRAHTPRAAVSTTFTYILCQVVRMSGKHMVGSVHRRDQQKLMPKCSICDACGPCQTIRSIMKPVFRLYQRIYCTYESLRCLDLQIRRFLC